MKPFQIPLEEGKFYHIFNRGNNGDNLFYKPENYRFFLRRMEEYLLPSVELYAYCLLPNHFHLLIRVKEYALGEALHLQDEKLLQGRQDNSVLAGQAFHRLFTSYSKAINKQELRHGSLFENPFKRREVTSDQYFSNLVLYIHANPQTHGLCNDFRQYAWNSYERILSGKPSALRKEDVLNWFSGKNDYVNFHSRQFEFDKTSGVFRD
jgi:putative transposase